MTPENQQLLVQEIAPRIRSLAPSLTPIGCEDQEELTRDAIAIAVTLLASAKTRGKQVSAGNVSFFAAKLVRQGRRSTGQSRTDVMHPATQIAGCARLTSLDESIAGEVESDDIMCLHDVLAARSADPCQEPAK